MQPLFDLVFDREATLEGDGVELQHLAFHDRAQVDIRHELLGIDTRILPAPA